MPTTRQYPSLQNLSTAIYKVIEGKCCWVCAYSNKGCRGRVATVIVERGESGRDTVLLELEGGYKNADANYYTRHRDGVRRDSRTVESLTQDEKVAFFREQARATGQPYTPPRPGHLIVRFEKEEPYPDRIRLSRDQLPAAITCPTCHKFNVVSSLRGLAG